jgi:hypothetical protein
MKLLLTMLLSTAVASVMQGTAWAVPDSHPGKQFYLSVQPEEVADVIPVREEAKNGEAIVVIGRIGGRKNPWVKGACAFSLVDCALTPCNEMPGENCPTPWDYCCSPNLAKSSLLVMFVDDGDKVIRKDARELLGVKELDTVMIQGSAKRDKAGNVMLMAKRLYIPVDKEATQ